MIAYRVRSSGVSDVGLVRGRNEDSMLLRDEAGLWAVADGMGGHAHGRWASQRIADALAGVALTGELDGDVERVGAAVADANRAIAAAAEGGIAGSTVVILLVSGRRFAVLWAGDSRAYLRRDGPPVLLTRDHTLVQDLVSAGELSAEEALSHPKRHVLSRAVGAEEEGFLLDAIEDEVMPGDVFLLCSDGLTGLVADEEIGEHLAAAPPEHVARALLDLALARGAPDNVTIVVVGCADA